MAGKRKDETFSFRQTVTLTPKVGAAMQEVIDSRGVDATTVYREAIEMFLNLPPERFLPEDTIKALVQEIVRAEVRDALTDYELEKQREGPVQPNRVQEEIPYNSTLALDRNLALFEAMNNLDDKLPTKPAHRKSLPKFFKK